MVLLVAVPLAFGSSQVYGEQHIIAQAKPVVSTWAGAQGWQVTEVAYRQNALRVVALGPPPEADAASLRAALDAAGLSDVDVRVTLVVGGSKDLPATS